MNDCLRTMMREHELILEVLASLKAMADKLAAGDPVPRQDVADFSQFFRGFADKYHHGKEEERLFVKMVEAGFPQESGPIAVMLAEHDDGREAVRGLAHIGAGTGPLTDSEQAGVRGYVNQFVPLLYAHIQKEDNILYPMAQNAIAPEEFDRLDQACLAFEVEVRREIDVTGLKLLAADLLRRYPGDLGQLMVYEGCGASFPAPCHA